MSASDTHHQPILGSTLRQIPSAISPRCQRSACLGTRCPGWHSCGPATPGGGYLVQLTRVQVQTGPMGLKPRAERPA